MFLCASVLPYITVFLFVTLFFYDPECDVTSDEVVIASPINMHLWDNYERVEKTRTAKSLFYISIVRSQITVELG